MTLVPLSNSAVSVGRWSQDANNNKHTNVPGYFRTNARRFNAHHGVAPEKVQCQRLDWKNEEEEIRAFTWVSVSIAADEPIKTCVYSGVIRSRSECFSCWFFDQWKRGFTLSNSPLSSSPSLVHTFSLPGRGYDGNHQCSCGPTVAATGSQQRGLLMLLLDMSNFLCS